jgi:FdrA protein
LLVLSKLAAAVVTERVLDQVRRKDKPAVVCFLGSELMPIAAAGSLSAHTLQDAAYLAAAVAEGQPATAVAKRIEQETADLRAQGARLRKRLRSRQRYLRALFSGGTLATEALVIWHDMLGDVFSNVALETRLRLKDATQSEGHCALDLGEEEFTVGRPHPMIDNDLRIRRLLQEASDPEVAVIVLDVVLGYGAHPDPASELGPAVRRAREQAAAQGRDLLVVASATGTESDPQGLARQVKALAGAGVTVCSCNAAAARLAGFIVGNDK